MSPELVSPALAPPEHEASGDVLACVLAPGATILLVEVLARRGSLAGARETGLVELKTREALRPSDALDPVFAVPFTRRATRTRGAHETNQWECVRLEPGERLLVGVAPTVARTLGIARAVWSLEEKGSEDDVAAVRRCVELERARAAGPLAPAGLARADLIAALRHAHPAVHEYTLRLLRATGNRDASAEVLAAATRSAPPEATPPALAAALAQVFQPDLWVDRSNVGLASALAHGLTTARRDRRGAWLAQLGVTLGARFSPDAAEDARVRAVLVSRLADPAAGDLRALLERVVHDRGLATAPPPDRERAERLLSLLGG